MATLIDERPEDVETEQEEISQIQEEPQVEELLKNKKKSLISTKESQPLKL